MVKWKNKLKWCIFPLLRRTFLDVNKSCFRPNGGLRFEMKLSGLNGHTYRTTGLCQIPQAI